MPSFILPICFILWGFLIVRHRRSRHKWPPTNAAIYYAIKSYAVIQGLIVCLSCYWGWPKITLEDYRWIIGLGGIAFAWSSFDQIHNKVKRKAKKTKIVLSYKNPVDYHKSLTDN
jgi:hypothetical protein